MKLLPTILGQKINVKNDIVAGLITAAVSIPIAMGYAQIAGLPAVYGLYGSVLPILVFALISTSPHMIFGVDAVTTGASSDLRNVAELSKSMIVEEGMGSGTRNLVFPSEATGYYTITTGKPYSEKTAEIIDAEIKKLSDEAAKRAEDVLKTNKVVLDKLAEELLAHETLEEAELAPILKETKLPTTAKLH